MQTTPLDTRGQTLAWRLIVQRLMDTLTLVPDAVELPADLALGQRRVAAAVDLLGLVVRKETLDVPACHPTELFRDLKYNICLRVVQTVPFVMSGSSRRVPFAPVSLGPTP